MALLAISPAYRATARTLAEEELLTRGHCPRYLDLTAFYQNPLSRVAVFTKSITNAVGHIVRTMLSVSNVPINFVDPPAYVKNGAPAPMIGAIPQAAPNP
ncbi:hypothetical protein BGX23_000762 [Mortierella sp. AD031]|nr:hypothetical protein BGX23_000762 [Mortierella sp. AD031]